MSGDLRFTNMLFSYADANPNSPLDTLTKRIFCVFVLPLMLANGIWNLENVDDQSNALKNLR